MGNHKVLRWLFIVPGRKKLYILLLTVFQCLDGFSGVVYALLLRDIVDHAVGKSVSGFVRSVVFMIALVLALQLLRMAVRRLNELSKASFENCFKERLTHNLLHKDFSRVSAVHSGEWLNRLTNDTVVVADSCTEIIPGFAGMAIKMLSALIMIILMQPMLSAIMIPGGIIVGIIAYAFRKVLRRLHKQMQEKDGQLRIGLQEMLGNSMMIRAYAAEEQCEADIAAKADEHKKARMKKNSFSNICNLGFGVGMYAMYLFGVIWCGWGILTGTISYGTLTAITQLIAQIQTPFANISGYLPRFYAMTASAERLMEAEEFSDEDEKTLTGDQVREYYRDELVSLGLDNVDFAYFPPADSPELLTKENMPSALSGFSLNIKKGEYVAFTGSSGCGKSTAIKLLMCIYRPDRGECYLRSENGRQPLDPSWRRLFAYVPQGNRLMNGTIRDAVSFADRDACRDDERIRRALEIACADEFVSELEDGADTMLGERGMGLSEGQMQRIAVARAVFSDRPVLILDEATSALDPDTERRLLQNLRAMTDKTVLIVTHRPAALAICDRVLNFSENGVEENGRTKA